MSEERFLGPYRILSTIGQGGAGRVFRALSPEGSEVAVKLLTLTLSPEAVRRFRRERAVMASLGEPEGFVPLLGSGDTPHGPYVVMPLLRGGSLRDRFRREGKLELEAAHGIGRELARALASAHLRKVVHRDVKPSNLLFTAEGELRVADLGLAKQVSGSARESLSKTGVLRGSVGFMPPEQMVDAKRAGPPADVFAWGAVIYEALAGSPAFGVGPPLEVIARVECGGFRPLRELRPDVPPALAAVVERCLAASPEARFQDAGELLRALDAASLAPPPKPIAAWVLGGSFSLGLLLSIPLVGPLLRAAPPASAPSAAPSLAVRPEVTIPSASPAGSPAPSASATPTPPPLPEELAPVSQGRVFQLAGVLARPMRGVALATEVEGERLAIATREGVYVWDLARARVLHELRGVTAVGVVGNPALTIRIAGRWLALAGDSLLVVDLERDERSRVASSRLEGRPATIAFGPEGTLRMLSAQGKLGEFASPLDPAPRWIPHDPSWDLRYVQSERAWVSAHLRGVRVEGAAGAEVYPFARRPQGLRIDRAGNVLLFFDTTLSVLSPASGLTPVHGIPLGPQTCIPAVSSDRRYAALAAETGLLSLYDLTTGERVDAFQLAPLQEVATSLSWASARELLVGTSRGRVLRYRVRQD